MGKVRELDEFRNRKISSDGGGGGMDNYATHKDLKYLEEKIDLKLEALEKNVKVMLLEEREYHRKNKIDSIKWIVGTGIAIVGLTFTTIRYFL